MSRTSWLLLNESNQKILEKMIKIPNHEYNDSNGGSSRYYITHKENKKIKINKKEINKALKFESEFQLGSIKTYKKFNANIKNEERMFKN